MHIRKGKSHIAKRGGMGDPIRQYQAGSTPEGGSVPCPSERQHVPWRTYLGWQVLASLHARRPCLCQGWSQPRRPLWSSASAQQLRLWSHLRPRSGNEWSLVEVAPGCCPGAGPAKRRHVRLIRGRPCKTPAQGQALQAQRHVCEQVHPPARVPSRRLLAHEALSPASGMFWSQASPDPVRATTWSQASPAPASRIAAWPRAARPATRSREPRP